MKKFATAQGRFRKWKIDGNIAGMRGFQGKKRRNPWWIPSIFDAESHHHSRYLLGFGAFGKALSIALCCLLLTACGAKVTGITMEVPANLVKGESATATLTAAYDKPDASAEEKAKAFEELTITYASSDEKVATVDANGTIKAVGGGKATVSVAVGELHAEKEVMVTVPVTGVTADSELALAINGTESGGVNAAVLPADATEQHITYASSDETVATVDENGTVTAIGKGECTVTATCEDKTAETAVTVKIGATGIRLEQGTGGTIAVGGGVKLVARTVPVEADASTYTYKSGNEKIATVNSEGTVTGVSTGSTTITVTSADGHIAEYKVTVAIKCGYCGGFGHTQSNCSVRQADIAKQQAAKAAAAKQQASGGKTGTQNAATGGAAAASGGGGGAPAPTPAPAPAPAPAPPTIDYGEDSPTVGVGGGAGHDAGDLT